MTGRAESLSLLVADAVRRLDAAGIEEPRMEARALARAVLGFSREAMLADPNVAVALPLRGRFQGAVDRRCRREPFARIIGRREFWSLDFELGPDTLIPRPDTETVVEAALAAIGDRGRPLRVLDLGTGSGCILLALLFELPAAWGLGIDRSEGAAEVAARNARRLGLDDRARFVVGDWGAALAGPFDVIVCNPPYVRIGDRAGLAPEVRDFDPPAALFAGEDGLDACRAVAPDLARLLAPDGAGFVEVGAGQAVSAAALFAASGLAAGASLRDLAGHQRVVPVTAPVEKKSKKKIGNAEVTH